MTGFCTLPCLGLTKEEELLLLLGDDTLPKPSYSPITEEEALLVDAADKLPHPSYSPAKDPDLPPSSPPPHWSLKDYLAKNVFDEVAFIEIRGRYFAKKVQKCPRR